MGWQQFWNSVIGIYTIYYSVMLCARQCSLSFSRYSPRINTSRICMFKMIRLTLAIIKDIEFYSHILSPIPPYNGQCLHIGSYFCVCCKFICLGKGIFRVSLYPYRNIQTYNTRINRRPDKEIWRFKLTIINKSSGFPAGPCNTMRFEIIGRIPRKPRTHIGKHNLSI
jgi:hypothetical protein